jgi:hypothetical protein
MNKKTNLPKFVSFGGGMRLIENEYYRDGGHWSVGYKFIDGKLVTWCWGQGMPWLHRKPLIEITEEEWRIGNGVYAPKDI